MANQMLSRNDSTGTLKMTISAGKHPAVVHSGPFYLMKVSVRIVNTENLVSSDTCAYVRGLSKASVVVAREVKALLVYSWERLQQGVMG